MNMPRDYKPNTDVSHFRKILKEGVILVGGEIVDGNSIDFDDDDPVSVAIMYNVNGYGPHVAAICATQGGHPDSALQAADEILEEWEREHYPAENDEDEEHRTETFDGQTWELTPQEFAEAIRGTPAVKFLNLEEELAEGPTTTIAEEASGGVRKYGPGKFDTLIDSHASGVTLDSGLDEEIHSDDGSFYGLIRVDDAFRKEVRDAAASAGDTLNSAEEELLNESAAIIFFERSDGIVEADWYEDLEEAEEHWGEIEEEFNDDESEDDDEEEDDDDEEVASGEALEEAPRAGARPDRITVYWDETDRSNVGWAYDAFYPNRHMTSGAIDGRRDMSDATLTSRARAAVGHPGTRIPVKVER